VSSTKEKAAQDEDEQKENEFSISRELIESLIVQLRENSQESHQSDSEKNMKQNLVVSQKKNEKDRNRVRTIVLIDEILETVLVIDIEDKL
jgi:predicted amidophosphoribosyltransferase